LLRIPYTFNSKCLKEGKEKSKVKIILEFDKDNIPSINVDLPRSFRLWLVDNEIKDKQ